MRLQPLPAATFALAALATLAAVTASSSPLRAQPGPPTRVYGSLTIDGAQAPIGTLVTAVVNGRDCGARTTDVLGQYWVDVQGEGQTPGCAKEGQTVAFRAGARFAAQTTTHRAGQFVSLSLTVSGAGLPPVGGGAPPASPTVSPTTAPSGPFTRSALDLTGDRCIPAADEPACDAAREALWRGDATAWTAREVAAGRPAPDTLDIALLRARFRADAGDPGARSRFARFDSYPRLYITSIRYRGAGEFEGDEYLEVANLGGWSQDLTGWRVRAVEAELDLVFTEGAVLEPGARCRFYTGAAREDSCPGSIELAGSGIWPDVAGSAELWDDGNAALVHATRYAADPAAQPPAPALQGIR